jgi:hypothetical protein
MHIKPEGRFAVHRASKRIANGAYAQKHFAERAEVKCPGAAGTQAVLRC